MLLLLKRYNSIRYIVDCVWNQWNPWSACSITCGSGFQTRERSKKQQARNNGKQCDGNNFEVQHCHLRDYCFGMYYTAYVYRELQGYKRGGSAISAGKTL